MKKVFFKVFIIAFAAIVSVGFTSCSSDDAEKAPATTDVNVDYTEVSGSTRAIGACIKSAFSYVTGLGYVSTGKTVQIACDFTDTDGKINAVTTDAEGLIPADFVVSKKFTYTCDDVQFVIEDKLAAGHILLDEYTPMWQTGSLTGYEFKKGEDYLYIWAGAHVVASNSYVNDNHSGGQLF